MFKKVLIVDDDHEMLLSLKEGFGKYSSTFSVLTAEDGLIAMEKLKKHVISLVITDLRMPQMDGFETTRIIRELEEKQESHPPIPIVAITAKAMKDDKQKCLDVGMNEFITKPILMKDLKDALSRFKL